MFLSGLGSSPSGFLARGVKTKTLFLEGAGRVLKLLFPTYLLPARISLLGALFIRDRCLLDFAFLALLLFHFGGARSHSVVEFAASW